MVKRLGVWNLKPDYDCDAEACYLTIFEFFFRSAILITLFGVDFLSND